MKPRSRSILKHFESSPPEKSLGVSGFPFSRFADKPRIALGGNRSPSKSKS